MTFTVTFNFFIRLILIFFSNCNICILLYKNMHINKELKRIKEGYKTTENPFAEKKRVEKRMKIVSMFSR